MVEVGKLDLRDGGRNCDTHEFRTVYKNLFFNSDDGSAPNLVGNVNGCNG